MKIAELSKEEDGMFHVEEAACGKALIEATTYSFEEIEEVQCGWSTDSEERL